MRNRIAVLFLVFSVFAGDTAYQTAQTEYFKAMPKVIAIKGLSGDLRIKHGEEAFYQSITRFDAGDVDESRRLAKLNEIIATAKNDTFFITVLPPVEYMPQIKNYLGTFFQGKLLAEYRSRTIEFSGGIEYRTDFVLQVPESMAVLSDIALGRVVLDSPKGKIVHTSLSTELRGVVSGDTQIRGDELDVELGDIKGKLQINARKMEFEMQRGFSGSLDINTDYGDILIRTDQKAKKVNLRQKRGRFTWSGESPDTLIVNATEPEFEGEFSSAGYLKINQKAGSIKLRLPIDSYGRVDAQTMDGKARFRTPEGLTKDRRSMFFEAEGTGSLILRTERGDIDISLID